MNPQINSVKESSLVNALQKYKHNGYMKTKSVSKVLPSLSEHIEKVSPRIQNAGSPFSKEIVFDIPRTAHGVYGMMIESTMTSSSDDNADRNTHNIGEKIFERLELRNKSGDMIV